MSSKSLSKFLIRPSHLFTHEGWERLKPIIETIPDDGGCLVLLLEAQPNTQNFLTIHIATMTAKQRHATRKAVLKAGGKAV